MRNELSDDAIAHLRAHLSSPDRGAVPELIEMGFASVVVRFGGTVARIARNEDAARGHAREVGTLAILDGRLPVQVPAPSRLVPPGPELPNGAALQPFLPGRVMTERDAVVRPELAQEIAAMLATLHGVDPSPFPAGSLWTLDPHDELERLDAQTRRVLADRLDPRQGAALDRLFAQARRDLPKRERVVCHADAWYGNMLVDPDCTLTGVLDFEHACLADPAFDLSAQTYLHPPSAEAVIAAYEDRVGPLADRDARIRGHLLIRELEGLAYGIRNRMEDEIEHSMVDVRGLLT